MHFETVGFSACTSTQQPPLTTEIVLRDQRPSPLGRSVERIVDRLLFAVVDRVQEPTHQTKVARNVPLQRIDGVGRHPETPVGFGVGAETNPAECAPPALLLQQLSQVPPVVVHGLKALPARLVLLNAAGHHLFEKSPLFVGQIDRIGFSQLFYCRRAAVLRRLVRQHATF